MNRLSGASTIEMNCDVDSALNDHAAIVAAIELDDEAQHGVEEREAPERAAGEMARALFEQQQRDQDHEARGRFVQLRRMQRRR